MNKQVKFIIGIIGLIIVVFFIAKSDFKNREIKEEPVSVNQASVLEVKENDWVSGVSTAKVTLVEYLDFECEACGAYYPIVTQLKEEYKDDMRVVIRYFPLPGHKNSRTAAHAVEAAGKQGKFWEMYSILFTKQSEWGEQQVTNQDQFEKYAIEAGVNIDQWRIDVKSDEVKKRVEDSYKEAMSLNLQGTPSFFLNGKKVESPKGYESFKLLIEKAKSN
jgi:protein-disulfide isomerase